MRRTRNPVYGYTVSRVRIPLAPPIQKTPRCGVFSFGYFHLSTSELTIDHHETFEIDGTHCFDSVRPLWVHLVGDCRCCRFCCGLRCQDNGQCAGCRDTGHREQEEIKKALQCRAFFRSTPVRFQIPNQPLVRAKCRACVRLLTPKRRNKRQK
jgi:hypothetical protein